MPSPAGEDLHLNQPLTDFTVQALYDEKDFALFKMAPVRQVEKESNKYYTYTTGDWTRDEMQLRGRGQESAGSGWAVSNTTYSCQNYAVHTDFDTADELNADDPVKPERDASVWLKDKARIKGDVLCGAELFLTGIWDTEVDGTASGATEGTSFIYWDDASGDPQADVLWAHESLAKLILRRGNTMVVGAKVHRAILKNAAVRNAIRYTNTLTLKEVRSKLEDYFDVENYVVGWSAYNSAEEGQTASMGFILGSEDAWVGYVDPNPGLRTITAATTFAWKGPDGFGNNGMVGKTIPVPLRRSNRYEADWFIDVKVVASAAGVFFDDCIT